MLLFRCDGPSGSYAVKFSSDYGCDPKYQVYSNNNAELVNNARNSFGTLGENLLEQLITSRKGSVYTIKAISHLTIALNLRSNSRSISLCVTPQGCTKKLNKLGENPSINANLFAGLI